MTILKFKIKDQLGQGSDTVWLLPQFLGLSDISEPEFFQSAIAVLNLRPRGTAVLRELLLGYSYRIFLNRYNASLIWSEPRLAYLSLMN
ncbi:hypothetical protein CEXT_515891 [Caerostris extrusa]|uniref:Uncharacterized protein n=1 Tax=Caerostris extrusa TaxID=172846 RepID=A0AAV4UUN8_CAEEX|nr:hypothetical protein CEXT_515891 [Caerostris extrusa]